MRHEHFGQIIQKILTFKSYKITSHSAATSNILTPKHIKSRTCENINFCWTTMPRMASFFRHWARSASAALPNRVNKMAKENTKAWLRSVQLTANKTLKRKFRYKRSVARPLTASVVNQPPSRADLIVRAGSYLLFRGNRCCKFSSTGAQNYALSWQTQVNTKLKCSLDMPSRNCK